MKSSSNYKSQMRFTSRNCESDTKGMFRHCPNQPQQKCPIHPEWQLHISASILFIFVELNLQHTKHNEKHQFHSYFWSWKSSLFSYSHTRSRRIRKNCINFEENDKLHLGCETLTLRTGYFNQLTNNASLTVNWNRHWFRLLRICLNELSFWNFCSLLRTHH